MNDEKKMAYRNVSVDSFGLTHRGKVRSVNQDQYLIGSIRKVMDVESSGVYDPAPDELPGGSMAQLLIIADGVGGHAAGEKASSLATTTVADYVTGGMRCFYHLDDQHRDAILEELESAVQLSHEAVCSVALKDPELAGMATTLTVAHVLWPRAYIIHVGDSRCYLLRGRELAQITKDQTLAQELVDQGALTPDAAERSPLSNVLSSAVGLKITPVPSTVDLETGDTLMLCSDGLTKHLGSREIAEFLRAAQSAEDACDLLLDAALRAGGSDNITIIVSRYGEAKIAAASGDAVEPMSGADSGETELWLSAWSTEPAEVQRV